MSRHIPPLDFGRHRRPRSGTLRPLAWLKMDLCRHVFPALAAGLLVGCGAIRKNGPVEIVYWTGWSGHELDVQQRLAAEFNKAHPNIRVRVVTQFGNSGYQKVRIAFAGGATPDVMSTVWADELAAYAKRGVLTPLDDYLAQKGRSLDQEFVPGLQQALRVDGKTYALAATTNTAFIVYNKSIFREAGLDPDNPPRTTDELYEATRRCTVVNKDGSFKRNGYRPGDLRTMAYLFGGGWFDAKTKKVTANHPRNIEALRWMSSFNKLADLRRIQTFQSTFGSESTPNGPFFVGKIAMWSTGEWSSEFLRRYAPNIDYGFFATPAPPGGKPNTIFANGSVFVIPAACKNKKEAWEFLNWITSPYAVRTFCSSIGNVPPLLDAGKAKAFEKPLMKFAIDLTHSKNAVGPPGISIWPTYAREITRAEEAVMLGGKDPKQVLDDLQFRMDREYQRSVEELGG